MAAPLTPDTVAVLGASGQIGRFALPMLARGGRRVLAISRHGRPQDYPELPGVDWMMPEAGTAASPTGIGSLLSAGPIGLAHDWLVQQPDVRRAVVVSSSSVISKSDSADPGERAMIAALVRSERRIIDHCRRRGIDCTILRPTLIYGAGMDDNLTRLLRWIERHGWLPLASDAEGLRQPIHAADLAEACVSALLMSLGAPLVSALCGGSTLSYRAMVERLFDVAGRSPRVVTLPAWLLASVVALAAKTPWLKGTNPEMVRRQGTDLVFDDTEARRALGIEPRPFAPRPEDFRPPTSAVIHALRERDLA